MISIDAFVSLRIADIGDAEMLTRLSVTTFATAFGSANSKENMDKYLTANMSLQNISAELNDTAGIFVLAETGNEATGYMKMRLNKAPPALNGKKAIEIERLYILAAYQNRKIGDRLMDHCFAHATQNGLGTIWLGVWEHNPKAIRFYERKGFEVFGSHPFLLGDDLQTDLLMKKELK